MAPRPGRECSSKPEVDQGQITTAEKNYEADSASVSPSSAHLSAVRICQTKSEG